MTGHYHINVSKDGRCLFGTERGPQLSSLIRAKNVFKIIKEKFPSSESYEVTCTHWKYEGKEIDIDRQT